MIEIIKNIFSFLLPLIEKFLKSKSSTDAKPLDDNDYCSRRRFNDAKKYLLKNIDAYLRGRPQRGLDPWVRGAINGRKYNNINICSRPKKIGIGTKYLKVYRHYSKDGYKLIKSKTIKKSEFRPYGLTWCNVLVGVFGSYYNIGNTQFYSGKEYNAKVQIQNIGKGFYDNELVKFIKCSQSDAELYAKKYGYAVATWIPMGNKAAHITVMLGKKKILQAGADTGIMTISKGFGKDILDEIVYYKLVWS